MSDRSTADDARALSSDIKFVDFDTWTAEYSLDIAEFATTTAPADN